MKNLKLTKILFISFIIPIVVSCKKNKETFDVDLSNFKPVITNTKIEIKESSKEIKKDIINKLSPLVKRDKVISSIKYGKKDPFSALQPFGSNNASISGLKLHGFISLDNKDYALVQYLDSKGLINKDSVGGLNTNLIPKEAIVKQINPEKQTIYLFLDDEIFEIKLNSK